MRLAKTRLKSFNEGARQKGVVPQEQPIQEAAMKIAAWFTVMILAPVLATAGAFTNTGALKGLTTVKVVVDVNVGDPELLLRRIELIDETYTQILDAGIKPVFVVAFRGPATRYVTRGKEHVAPEHEAVKKKIQGWIGQFRENGFTLEQCAIAARGQKVPAGDILPEITVVQNGYISIVAYQNKGFALLPMD
jgi:uncharacterized protein